MLIVDVRGREGGKLAIGFGGMKGVASDLYISSFRRGLKGEWNMSE